jgi:EmrB/QacA subfamily drug resistance transporter
MNLSTRAARHLARRPAEAAASGPASAASGGPDAQHRGWSVLVLLSVAQFMVILDMTIVNVALPSIGRALHFSPGGLQWTVTTYLLFTGGLMLLGGRAADLLGRRRMFLTGLAIFTAASLASGLAPSAGLLIAARGAQGLGAALLSPAALAIITATYTGAQRAAALATWGALGSGGAAVGVLAGGVLTGAFGWRAVFLVNVPIGLAAGLASRHAIPVTPASLRAGRDRRLDLPGAALATAGLVVLVFALAGTASHGWASVRTVVLLVAGIFLLGSFAAAERRATQPLLPPQMWRNRPLVAGMAVMFGATGILVGTFYLNSLYLQDVLGAGPLLAGTEFLPLVLAIGLAAHLAAHLLPRFGARVLAVAGLAVLAGGGLLLAQASASAGYATGVLPGLVILGFGVGLVFPAATVAGMSHAGAGQEGLASGMMTTAHEVGAALGVAVFAAVAAGARHAATETGLAAGYQRGYLVAAAVAAGLAVIAVLALPAARPAVGQRVAVH